MYRYLPVAAVILLIIGITAFVVFLKKPQELSQSVTPKEIPLEVPKANQSAPIDERVKTLEDQMVLVVTQLKKQSSSNTSITGSSDSKIQDLENAIINLQNEVNLLKTGTKTTTNVSSNKSPLYIPLGWTGSSTGLDWAAITTQQITLNPDDYPGYKSMQFEASIRAYQGNGTTYARLYNSKDGTSVLSSQVSTGSENYTWVSSGNFTLPSGQRTYQLQLKSLTGYSADIQNARIKINF